MTQSSEKPLRFDGQVAVITGAGRGLGRAYALLLAERGAKVIVNDLGGSMAGDGADKSPAQSVVEEIIAAGGEAEANTDSVASESGAKAMIEQAKDTYGRLDILVHNAGNVRYGSLLELSYDDFNAVLDVHLRGAYLMVRAAFGEMHKANYGRVVLTSSISGLYGLASAVNYGVSKAGIIGLNNVVALEGAEHNIKSNIILPGAVTRMAEGIDTSQFPPMTPEMVAPVVGWLAHESCSVSGELYVSMAGRVARALICESEGVFQPEWSMEAVQDNIDAIRSTDKLWQLSVLPSAFSEHMTKSFMMASAKK